MPVLNCELFAILQDGKPSPSPIAWIDFIDDDECRLKRFVEHIEQQLTYPVNQGGFLSRRNGFEAAARALTCNLYSQSA
jgi:hypothetical protein